MDEAQKAAEAINNKLTALESKVDKAATPESVTDATNALETFKTENAEALKGFVASKDFETVKAEVETLKTELSEANREMVAMAQRNSASQPYSFKQAILDALTPEKFKEVKEHLSNRNGGWVEVTVKAPALITTANATGTAASAVYGASMATSFSPYTYGAAFVEQYLTIGSTDKPSLPYVNESAGEGDAAIVAEGGLKPLIDADYVVKYSEAVKIAGRMKASEEALYDYKWLASAMEGKLKVKHDRARQADVLTKVIAGATAFNSALLSGIALLTNGSSTMYDQLAAVIATVAVESNGVYIPNVAFINTIDALNMKLTKDTNGNYVMPPFSTADGRQIDGVTIVAQPDIAAGTYVIGDLKNINLDNVWGYTVRIGWENDDFSKNLITMLGESRYHVYITDNDKRGIVKGTFAAVATAIEAA